MTHSGGCYSLTPRSSDNDIGNKSRLIELINRRVGGHSSIERSSAVSLSGIGLDDGSMRLAVAPAMLEMEVRRASIVLYIYAIEIASPPSWRVVMSFSVCNFYVKKRQVYNKYHAGKRGRAVLRCHVSMLVHMPCPSIFKGDTRLDSHVLGGRIRVRT